MSSGCKPPKPASAVRPQVPWLSATLASMDAQFAFAQAAFAAGKRDEAAEALLQLIRTDPQWNEGAAKAKLLQIFEAVGLEDPWVSSQRRKLSLLLFG